MQQIIEVLKQTLLEQHLPNEQIQNILGSVDINQINLQDLPATIEYVTQFLGSYGLDQAVIETIQNSLMSQLAGFGNMGLENLGDIGVNQDDIVGTVKNIFGGFFGRLNEIFSVL